MDKLYSYFLQSPACSAAQAACCLYDTDAVGPVDEAAGIYENCKRIAGEVIYRHLDFAGFKKDGEFVNELPEKFNLDVVTAIESEYQSFIDSHDLAAMVASAEDSFLKRVEVYAWTHGLVGLSEAIAAAVVNLKECSDQYARMCAPVDDTVLLKSYEEAARQTLLERISGSNHKDILIYRQDLIEYLERKCKVIMNAFFARFFTILSCSSVIMDTQSRISGIVEFLKSQGVEEIEATGTELPQDFFEGDFRIFTSPVSYDPETVLKDAYAKLVSIWN